MNNLIQDLRYAARVLAKRPAFTLVAVVTLALGIGVNTAIFSAVKTLILRPSPVENPDALVNAFLGSEREAHAWGDFSYPDYQDFRDQTTVFSGLIAHRMTSVALSDSGSGGERERAEIIWGETVSGNYFDVLGVRPAPGRGFLAEEDGTPGTHPVVVFSHALWQRRFASDPGIINQTVYLNGQPFTVVGVAPASFPGTKFPLAMDFWVPLVARSQLFGSDTWRTNRDADFLMLTGRLAPGATREQAQTEMTAVLGRLAELYPDTRSGLKIEVVPELEGRASDAFPLLRLISVFALAVVALVLLLACANVANLMLSRSAARSREIAIRLALGASRFRIIRQLFTESLLLALCGGALGVLVAFWATDLMDGATPSLPYRLNFSFAPDWGVMQWAAGISLLTGVVFGLAPALNASRTNLVPVIKGEAADDGRGRLRRRWSLRNLLVVAQLAISMVVLVCAGLLLHSLRNLQAADPGFKTDQIVSMQLDPELLGYKEADGKRFYAELARRASTLPGVASATVSQVVPLSDNSYSTGPLILDGQEPPPPNQGVFVYYSSIGTRYFETMGTELVAGRDFTEQDNADASHVAILNQTLARRLFGSEQDALGKRFYLGDKKRPPLEVVGIARDGKYRNLFEDPRNYMFVPHQQRFYWSQATLLARLDGGGDLRSVTEAVRQEVERMDSRLPVYDIKTGDELLSYAVWGPRIGAWLASAFGLLALTLAATGLYSVMAYAVSRRTREIGIRMALGARPRDVLRLVIGQGVALIATGILIGTAAAFALTRVMSTLLYGVSASDPFIFALIALLLAGVALVACYVPARRATRVDPMVALRYE